MLADPEVVLERSHDPGAPQHPPRLLGERAEAGRVRGVELHEAALGGEVAQRVEEREEPPAPAGAGLEVCREGRAQLERGRLGEAQHHGGRGVAREALARHPPEEHDRGMRPPRREPCEHLAPVGEGGTAGLLAAGQALHHRQQLDAGVHRDLDPRREGARVQGGRGARRGRRGRVRPGREQAGEREEPDHGRASGVEPEHSPSRPPSFRARRRLRGFRHGDGGPGSGPGSGPGAGPAPAGATWGPGSP